MVRYSMSVIMALKKSENEMLKLSHEIVGIEHFILGILSFENSVKNTLNKYGITYTNYLEKLLTLDNEKVKDNSGLIFYSNEFKRIIDLSGDSQKDEIELQDIFINALETNTKGSKIIKSYNIDITNLYKDLLRSSNNRNLLIYEIGTNLNELAKNGSLDKVVGRKKEINQIIEILARKNKNNPILIGEAGVGKSALVEGLAYKIVNDEVPNFLRNKVIVSLNISDVISGTKYRGEFEEKLNKILKECHENDSLILFIDEVHTIVGAGGAEGAIDASNILKPVLARGNIKIIGATTINEYKKYIELDKALDRRFQKVYVKETSEKQTLKILKAIKINYEDYHDVKINDELLSNIVKLSKKYIFDRNEPDRSIDILDEACAHTIVLNNEKEKKKYKTQLKNVIFEKEKAIRSGFYAEAELLKNKEKKLLTKIQKNNFNNEVTYPTLKKVIESKCNSYVDIYSNNEKFYKNIEAKVNKAIIGQEKAIKKIIDAIKVSDKKTSELPVTLLLKGSKGVGKKESAKKISEVCKKNFIYLDMSNYFADISMSKFVGSPQGYIGYNDTTTVFEEIKLNPNSFIFLKNFDKAHTNIQSLFLDIFNTGIMKNSKNEVVNFSNCIFFITMNNANKDISVGYLNNIIKENCDKENYDYTIDFNNLAYNDIIKIINNIAKIKDKSLLNKIIEESGYKENGAKKIKFLINKYNNVKENIL